MIITQKYKSKNNAQNDWVLQGLQNRMIFKKGVLEYGEAFQSHFTILRGRMMRMGSPRLPVM